MNLNEAKAIYLSSLDISELSAVHSSLSTDIVNNAKAKMLVSSSKDIKEHYEIAEGLFYRLGVKLCLIRYATGFYNNAKVFFPKYSEAGYLDLIDFAGEANRVAEEKNYGKTKRIAEQVAAVIEPFHAIITEAISAANALYQTSELTDSDDEAIEVAKNTLIAAKEKLAALSLDGIFPDDVALPPIINTAIQDIDDELERVKRDEEKNISERLEKILSTAIVELPVFSDIRFYHEPYDKARMNAKALVVCTPLDDEALLFAYKLAESNGKAISRLDINELRDKNEGELRALFDAIIAKERSLIFFGFEKLDAKQQAVAYNGIFSMAKAGLYAIVLDKSGTKALYETLKIYGREQESYSDIDLVRLYLRMPNYAATVDALVGAGVITDSEQSRERIKRGLAFSGYVGINLAMTAYSGGLERAESLSHDNSSRSLKYIEQLSAARHFIDSEWGDYSDLISASTGERRSFDYDGVREADVENIRRIVEAIGISIFAKAGTIVKYCMLAGEDVSIWRTLSIPEREERLGTATVMLAKLLSCDDMPMVKVVAKEDWTHGTAIGVCMNGGKRVEYRADHTDNYDELVDTVCHETYHAFQHTAEDGGYHEWYMTELGVNEYRIAAWTENFKTYISSAKDEKLFNAYHVQVVEADARIFASQCFKASNEAWHKISFI